MTPRLLHSAQAALLACSLVAAAAHGQAPAPGERWRMSMSGVVAGQSISMGAQEVCKPAGDEMPPADKNCTITNSKRIGNKWTAHLHCTGEGAMDGEMEWEFLSKDRYRGKMNATTSHGKMSMTHDGERLPGTCDANALQRQANAMQAQANEMQARNKAMLEENERQIAKMCGNMAGEGRFDQFFGQFPTCKDPKDRERVCAVTQDYARFNAKAAKDCGFDADKVRKKLCDEAEDKGKFNFIAGHCPALRATLAQRECAGRRFSSQVNVRYRAFCGTVSLNCDGDDCPTVADAPSGDAASASAADGTTAGSSAAPEAGPAEAGQPKSSADKAADALKKGKDKLRDLFKF